VDPDVTVEMTPEQMRAAQDARQETELGDAYKSPASTMPSEVIDTTPTTQPNHDTFAIAPGTQPGTPLAGATTKPVHKTLLEADPQLAAGLLVLRLELQGAHL
jgi:hypothetical protein